MPQELLTGKHLVCEGTGEVLRPHLMMKSCEVTLFNSTHVRFNGLSNLKCLIIGEGIVNFCTHAHT